MEVIQLHNNVKSRQQYQQQPVLIEELPCRHCIYAISAPFKNFMFQVILPPFHKGEIDLQRLSKLSNLTLTSKWQSTDLCNINIEKEKTQEWGNERCPGLGVKTSKLLDNLGKVIIFLVSSFLI